MDYTPWQERDASYSFIGVDPPLNRERVVKEKKPPFNEKWAPPHKERVWDDN